MSFIYLQPGARYGDKEKFAVGVLLPNSRDDGQHFHMLRLFDREIHAAAYLNFLHGGLGIIDAGAETLLFE